MTATLREEQQSELVNECDLIRYNERPGELNEIASAPRYRLRQTSGGAALKIVSDAIAKKKARLVGCKPGQAAQLAYLACRTLNLGVPLFCYHSRFRLHDRRDRHEEVVKAFRKESAGTGYHVTSLRDEP